MKKILFVTESLGRGGMERVLVDIANALTEEEYDVTILLYENRMDLSTDLNSKVHLQYKQRKPLKIRRRLPYFHRFYNKDKWEKRASAKALYRYYVRRKKYDIEVGFYRGPSIKIISGSSNKKSKKLAWVHTDFKLCDPKSITKFFNNIDEVKLAYSKFDKVVCVSEKAKESFIDVIGLPNEKCRVIYNMLDTEKIIKKSQEDCPLEKNRFTVATVGRLIPDKGFDRLINAVNRLNDDGYEFDLWIIGGGRSEDELKKLTEENKLTNVVFTGMQENPYKYLKNADIFICSSVREGFSLAVAEALVLGIPVLSTRCTGPVEILEDGKYGLLVENSEDGIYNGLKSVLSDHALLNQSQSGCADRGLAFDKNVIINQIINLVEG